MNTQLSLFPNELEDIEQVYIDSTQRKEILQWVGRIGKKTNKRYAKVHIVLQNRYRVKSYRYIPTNKFEDALQFLKKWYNQL